MSKYTLRELLHELQQLKPEQLDSPARWVGEERGGLINGLWILEEDYFNPSGDGAEPVSSYRPREDEAFNADEGHMSEEEISEEFNSSGIPAGRVYISVD